MQFIGLLPEVDSGQCTVDSFGIFLRKIIEIVGKADTLTFNFQLSTINCLSYGSAINWNLPLCAIILHRLWKHKEKKLDSGVYVCYNIPNIDEKGVDFP